jgi:hypothetical protein
LNGSQEGGGLFGVAGGNASPALEMKESILDQVTQLVEGFVVVALEGSVLFGRNDGGHPLLGGSFENGIGIITPVGQEIIGPEAFNQRASLRAISRGASCNKHSERQTMRIHGQVNFGVEPPFVRLMA